MIVTVRKVSGVVEVLSILSGVRWFCWREKRLLVAVAVRVTVRKLSGVVEV